MRIAGVKNVRIVIKLILIGLIAAAFNGCTFIIKEDQAAKYYGIDEQRGSEFLNQILDNQQQAYQAEKASVNAQKP